MSSPLNTLQSAALAAAEQLINQSLSYDPASLEAIAGLQDRVIAVDCTFPPLNFYVQHHSGGLRLSIDLEGDADTRLRGSALALATLAVEREQTSLAGSGVEITGDQALLQRVSGILRNMDIDWEAALAKLIGDVPAHMVGEAIRSASQWREQAAERATATLSEFGVEEAQLLPNHYQAATFADQVGQLRKDVDRLSARVSKIRNQFSDTESN